MSECAVFKRLICCAVLFVSTGPLQAASAAQWVEGTNYFLVQPPQPTTTPGKVEVLDVFSYGCPACNAFEPTFDKIKKALPDYAQVAYLPAAFNPQEDWVVLQRAFLAAQILGLVDKTHDAMYDAIWKNGSLATTDLVTHRLLPKAQQPTIEDVAKFYAHFGVKPEDFISVANSFTVESKMKWSDSQLMTYGVTSTPTIIINGKYRVTPASAGGYEQTIDLVQYLVAKEKNDK